MLALILFIHSQYVTNSTSSSLCMPISSVVTGAIESPESCESLETTITDNCRGFDEDFVELRTCAYDFVI